MLHFHSCYDSTLGNSICHAIFSALHKPYFGTLTSRYVIVIQGKCSSNINPVTGMYCSITVLALETCSIYTKTLGIIDLQYHASFTTAQKS